MQTTTMLSKLTDTTQTISFSEGDEHTMTGEVHATDVVVTTSPGSHSHGSSKVKLKNVVDYNWELRMYPGQLVAVHMTRKYLAYSIKAPNTLNPGTSCSLVRVVYYPKTGADMRALIKGMKGEVQDLAFAHIQNQAVLACIDELGNFYVHEIEVTDSGLRETLIAEIREDTAAGGAPHRVVWCPYIPDDDDDTPDEDVASMLLTTHANVARMWNLRSMIKEHGSKWVGSARALVAGGAHVLVCSEHSAPVVDAAFSPDGTALATASADGLVMFFQVYKQDEGSPRCLHRWQPHGGKPLSCLFFLDNHNNFNCDIQFWKFAVTGAENNTVIKIWSCKSWNCLQTITFTPSIGTEPASLGLKAILDDSASYLLLSDFRARSLYVLSITRDKDDTLAYCKSISEFLLPYPVLSFCVADAEEETEKCGSRCEDYHSNGATSPAREPDEFDQEEELIAQECGTETSNETRVRLRLYIVQPKGLQEGELIFTPPAPKGRDLVHGLSELTLEDKSSESASGGIASSILQQQSQQLKNLLMRSQTQPGSLIGQRPESPTSIAPPLNLMTPDAFSSPGKRDEDDPPLSATPDTTKPRGSTAGLEEAPPCDSKLVSGGSSPSREVQRIMAHETYYKHTLKEETPPTPPTPPPADAASPQMNGAAIFDDADIFVPEAITPKIPLTNSDTAWPQISLAQINEANQRKASSDKSSSQSLNNSLNVSAVERVERATSEEVRPSGLSPGDKNRLEQLEQKLDKLCELVMQQSRELRTLRGEMASPRAMIDEALHAHSQRTTAAIESALQDGWERIARVGESASARAATAAGVGAARALEPLAAALQNELASKLTATDHLLRDNIEKLANSKTVMERLSSSIAKSLSEMVRESFRAALCESVVPVMEKAHSQIFRQINHAFQNGTKEFAANTEAAARAAAERGGAAATENLRVALERHAAALHGAAPPAAVLAATLSEVAHSVLEKELSWWREQARSAAVQASRAHTPSTPASSQMDRQMQMAQIQSLMNGGDVNGAFQLALSASDLTLVVGACRNVEPHLVFGPPCKLKQHVLLSLVQQLSADMARDTKLKHRYLEEAIMNLDTSNPVTREHLPAVIRELQKQIMAFLNASPGHALTRQFKMLLMATDSLLKNSV